MSLASFLLPGSSKGKAKAIDTGLDDLFRSTASALSFDAAPTKVPSSDKKRKASGDVPTAKVKRSKSEATVTPSSSKAPPKASKRLQTPVEDSSDSDEDEGDAQVEDESLDTGSSDSSEDEGDPSTLVHESLLKGGEKKSQSRNGKAKAMPSEETPGQRDVRTVFVGNVAIEVTKSRPYQKQLKRHLLSFVPSAKIESVRFRSIAFKKPTSELPTGDDDKQKQKAKTKSREHDRERAASGRPAKRFMTPKEKKRVAFIKHEIHDQADAVNAYVVFAHPPSAESLAARPGNVPPPAPVMDPYEAAKVCAEKGDGSVFMDRTLRVDVVKKGTEGGETTVGAESAMAGDPKATVFVGNLEFTSKEEDLRAFFEALVCEERGKPGEKTGEEESDDEDENEDEAEEGNESGQPRTWVKRVRIIRDRDTQLGKGFAYVQFVDRECVDEILALDQLKLKFAKRKLRVQRCKTLPGGPKLRASRPTRPPASQSSSQGPHSRPNTNTPRNAAGPRLVPASKQVPKGNPELGAKLAHLPKEERKKAKAMDADRVARRLAKKRATALADKGVKGVDRERVRKRPSEKGQHGVTAKGKGKEKPKKRVRSGKALAKMNTKK
ncbi:hypothetical protein C8Q80DRAFT_1141625 [Daedaleopsis nitida]|nr:hypothetical protein C8Q80DRAFT_1141625 [Daedaleopsis nitida]